jgi:hypothetical protein
MRLSAIWTSLAIHPAVRTFKAITHCALLNVKRPMVVYQSHTAHLVAVAQEDSAPSENLLVV